VSSGVLIAKDNAMRFSVEKQSSVGLAGNLMSKMGGYSFKRRAWNPRHTVNAMKRNASFTNGFSAQADNDAAVSLHFQPITTASIGFKGGSPAVEGTLVKCCCRFTR